MTTIVAHATIYIIAWLCRTAATATTHYLSNFALYAGTVFFVIAVVIRNVRTYIHMYGFVADTYLHFLVRLGGLHQMFSFIFHLVRVCLFYYSYFFLVLVPPTTSCMYKVLCRYQPIHFLNYLFLYRCFVSFFVFRFFVFLYMLCCMCFVFAVLSVHFALSLPLYFVFISIVPTIVARVAVIFEFDSRLEMPYVWVSVYMVCKHGYYN